MQLIGTWSVVLAIAIAHLAFCAGISFALPAKEWSILVYLNGDNDIEDDAVRAVHNMELIGSTDKINIVVQLDKKGPTGTWRYLMQKPAKPDDTPMPVPPIQSPVVETLPEQDMGSPDTLKNFLAWGMNRYPAKRYLVYVWNHGSGWLEKPKVKKPATSRGVSYDDHSGNHLTVIQVGDVLRGMSASCGKKIDLVAFEACLMQMAEVVSELADSCLFQVGSEETTKAWPHRAWLTQVVAHPEWDGLKMGSALVDAIRAAYLQGTSTMSLIELSKVAGLKTRASAFAKALLSNAAYKPRIKEVLRGTQSYLIDTNRDMVDFIELVLEKIDDKAVVEAGSLLKEFIKSELVAKNSYTGFPVSGSNGLSVWVPWDADKGQMENYLKLRWSRDTQWDEFLSTLTTDPKR